MFSSQASGGASLADELPGVQASTGIKDIIKLMHHNVYIQPPRTRLYKTVSYLRRGVAETRYTMSDYGENKMSVKERRAQDHEVAKQMKRQKIEARSTHVPSRMELSDDDDDSSVMENLTQKCNTMLRSLVPGATPAKASRVGGSGGKTTAVPRGARPETGAGGSYKQQPVDPIQAGKDARKKLLAKKPVVDPPLEDAEMTKAMKTAEEYLKQLHAQLTDKLAVIEAARSDVRGYLTASDKSSQETALSDTLDDMRALHIQMAPADPLTEEDIVAMFAQMKFHYEPEALSSKV